LQIAGGQGAAFNAEMLLRQTPVRAVVKGFGEMPLEQIAKDISFQEIPGIYHLQDGKVVFTDKQKKITEEEFKAISMGMDFKKIPYGEYWEFMESQYDEQHTKTMRNRGFLKTIRLMVSNYCPMGCTHCTSTQFLKGERLSFLEPKDIIAMMSQAVAAHPETEAFYFNDDNFLLLGEEKIKEFCERTTELESKPNLMFQGRVDEVGKKTLDKMAEARFKIAFYGVETFSDKLARSIKKRTGKKDYGEIARQTIKNTLDSGMTAQFSLMFFLPGSQVGDLETTIENSVDLMGQGARTTIFPYVEAYSGAKIVTEGHDISYKEFGVGGEHFKVPYLVLPDDKNIRELAEESLSLKEKLNRAPRWNKYNGPVPQPVDSLNLFRAVYNKLGKNTSKIEELLQTF